MIEEFHKMVNAPFSELAGVILVCRQCTIDGQPFRKFFSRGQAIFGIHPCQFCGEPLDYDSELWAIKKDNPSKLLWLLGLYPLADQEYWFRRPISHNFVCPETIGLCKTA